jgi:hypothetical protein
VFLGEGEPELGPWRVRALPAFAADVLERLGTPASRPRILAVDGRSASGKTTIAERLRSAVPGAATVHTDDVAWFHSCFDWAQLMQEGVLAPLHAGRAVAYRPPPWDARDRPGAIEVPAGATLVIVEGVGAGRRETAHLFDGVIWVQSDLREREARDDARVAAGEVDRRTVEEWMTEEWPFVAAQRPWERAFAVVAGTPELAHDRATEVVLGTPVAG